MLWNVGTWVGLVRFPNQLAFFKSDGELGWLGPPSSGNRAASLRRCQLGEAQVAPTMQL